MKPIPRPTHDITYCDLTQLRKMPSQAHLSFGWTVNNKGTYLVTQDDGGVRCQHWAIKNARESMLLTCSI